MQQVHDRDDGGEKVSLNIDRPEPENSREILKVSGLTCLDNEGVKSLDDVSFTAFGGEILGVAGIAGSGQKELLEAITNLCPIAEGTISCVNEHGKKLLFQNVKSRNTFPKKVYILRIFPLSRRTDWVWDWLLPWI